MGPEFTDEARDTKLLDEEAEQPLEPLAEAMIELLRRHTGAGKLALYVATPGYVYIGIAYESRYATISLTQPLDNLRLRTCPWYLNVPLPQAMGEQIVQSYNARRFGTGASHFPRQAR